LRYSSIYYLDYQVWRANQSIQDREKRFDQMQLNDEEIKELANDVAERWLLNKFLQQLQQGEGLR